ncbi:MAG TPA: hypothetical protein DCZ95_13325 [Verrucomicrobia bacterium]|nr:MAG: hypothetical protein A2X46_11185 [Lentisphaerae bacterium GWF2_57_35]HBA85067.1 hypothetical protein [Verrucomicrobiota bacterium]
MLLGLLFLGSSVQSGFALNKQEVKRQLVVVGYDLANNAAAMDVLNRMGEAARAAGGAGKVIMADKNEQALNAALTDAMNTVTRQQPTQPALKVIERAPALPGRVVVQHSAGSASNLQSWIGFYRADAPNNEYISYTFLKNLTDCKYDVQIEEPGQYNFRLFMDEGYAPTATSEVLEFK